MALIPFDSIDIPPDRQRKLFDTDAIEELADSIEAIGLLQPPILEEAPDGRYILRAGERRFRAIQRLNDQRRPFKQAGEAIPAGFLPASLIPSSTPLLAFQIELEENIIRRDLSWQERAAAVARLAELKAATTSSYSETVRETLATLRRVEPGEIKRDLSETHQTILLGQHLNDPEIAKARTRTDALKVLSRKLRAGADATRPPSSIPNLYLGDALDLLPTFPAGSFDVLLTDPPYGIDIEQFSTQSSSEQNYDDSYATWGPLLRALAREAARLLVPDAHGYVFCAHERFAELSSIFTTEGFACYPRPLIWNRAPDGRLPVPDKWPRRCYETVLYFRRGNRDLREYRPDVLSYPADRDSTNYHGAKKPVALLRDLLERSARPGDRVLDPFGGSGATLRACRELSLDCWLIEKDPAYFGLISTLET